MIWRKHGKTRHSLSDVRSDVSRPIWRKKRKNVPWNSSPTPVSGLKTLEMLEFFNVMRAVAHASDTSSLQPSIHVL